jgi:hypothetical protein
MRTTRATPAVTIHTRLGRAVAAHSACLGNQDRSMKSAAMPKRVVPAEAVAASPAARIGRSCIENTGCNKHMTAQVCVRPVKQPIAAHATAAEPPSMPARPLSTLSRAGGDDRECAVVVTMSAVCQIPRAATVGIKSCNSHARTGGCSGPPNGEQNHAQAFRDEHGTHKGVHVRSALLRT